MSKKKCVVQSPTARHEAIAAVANEIRADGPFPPGPPYAGYDVAIIFNAWQEEYRRRKAAGKIKPSPHNRWRNPTLAKDQVQAGGNMEAESHGRAE